LRLKSSPNSDCPAGSPADTIVPTSKKSIFIIFMRCAQILMGCAQTFLRVEGVTHASRRKE
jgi:hypothetical protein